MFGQPPLTGAATKAIPYQTQFSVKSKPFSTVQDALDSCIADLVVAKDLLADTDTSAVLKAANDPFKSYTQSHLNYWAVQGLLARVYLYKGDVPNAEKQAKALIGSGKIPAGHIQPCFRNKCGTRQDVFAGTPFLSLFNQY
jgi:hypothetical protein